ncbi:hypothetical protein MJH54_30385, partial [Salmonella enterica subsp. enterica serovar Montevideo]|nr:hypothetical protein [Salmonella enterica subsp. enterica serovar Montevideo]
LSSLTRAVDELNRITQKNAALVEESAQVSAMVKHRASRLEDAPFWKRRAQFRLWAKPEWVNHTSSAGWMRNFDCVRSTKTRSGI